MPQNSAIPPKSIAERHLSFTVHGGAGNTYSNTVSNPVTSANAANAPLQCRYISIANIADLTSPGTVDGGTLVTGDVVCLAYQSTASENGIYVTNSSGELIRSGVALTPLALINVIEGTKWAETQWKITNAETFVVGTDDITIEPNGLQKAGISGSYNGGRLNISAGTGISLSPSGIDPFSNQVQIVNSGVTAINGQTGALSFSVISAGFSIGNPSSGVISFSNDGVTSLNGGAGGMTIAAGTGVTVNRSGNTITVGSTGVAGFGSVVVEDFVSNGTWTKPPGAKLVVVLAIGGGGGGASGECRGAGLIRKGGGGAGAGQRICRAFAAAVFGATADVIIGAGGAGGAGVTSGNGANGSYGTETIFNDGGTVLLTAQGGNHGVGGATPAGADGLPMFYEFIATTAPDGGDSSDGTANAANPADSYYLSGSGGGGGSIGTDGTRYHGGKGSKVNWTVGTGTSLIAAGNYGDSEGEDGGNGTTGTVGAAYLASSGAGGGASGDDAGTIDGGNGGNGSDYGAGGGGGGAATTGATSGAGGNGADGFLRVITYCG